MQHHIFPPHIRGIRGQFCGFFGKIRPEFKDDKFNTEEILHWAHTIEIVNDFFIRLDIGSPLADFTFFRGCSGGPIIDGRGKLIGIVTHGDKDLSSPYVYGFRIDTPIIMD